MQTDFHQQCLVCDKCGSVLLALPRHIFNNPERLVMAKESIRTRHTCKPRSNHPNVRVLRPVTKDRAWAELRKMLPAA